MSIVIKPKRGTKSIIAGTSTGTKASSELLLASDTKQLYLGKGTTGAADPIGVAIEAFEEMTSGALANEDVFLVTDDNVAGKPNKRLSYGSLLSKLGSDAGDIKDVKVNEQDNNPGYLSTKIASDGDLAITVDSTTLKINYGPLSIAAGDLANNIDASGKNFNAAKVGGKNVDDTTTTVNNLWTAQKISSYVMGVTTASIGAYGTGAGAVRDEVFKTTGNTYIVAHWENVFRTGSIQTGDQVLWGTTDKNALGTVGSVRLYTATVETGTLTWTYVAPSDSVHYFTDKKLTIPGSPGLITADEENNLFFIDTFSAQTYLGRITIEIPAYTAGDGLNLIGSEFSARLANSLELVSVGGGNQGISVKSVVGSATGVGSSSGTPSAAVTIGTGIGVPVHPLGGLTVMARDADSVMSLAINTVDGGELT